MSDDRGYRRLAAEVIKQAVITVEGLPELRRKLRATRKKFDIATKSGNKMARGKLQDQIDYIKERIQQAEYDLKWFRRPNSTLTVFAGVLGYHRDYFSRAVLRKYRDAKAAVRAIA